MIFWGFEKQDLVYQRVTCDPPNYLYCFNNINRVLYILTSVWVMFAPNAGQNLLFHCFLFKKLKKRRKGNITLMWRVLEITVTPPTHIVHYTAHLHPTSLPVSYVFAPNHGIQLLMWIRLLSHGSLEFCNIFGTYFVYTSLHLSKTNLLFLFSNPIKR